MSAEWKCRKRDQNECRKYLDKFQVFDHPLKQSTITVLESKGTRSKIGVTSSNASSTGTSTLSLDPLSQALDGSDPLSQFAKQDAIQDPLSQMAAEFEFTSISSKAAAKKKEANILADADSVDQWSSRRAGILNKYTTSEKLSIVTSFLTGGETMKTQTTMSEKVKYRLEQLDDFEEGSIRHMMDLSQQEYMMKIEQLNQELVQAWNTDQRVKALKIAIQCSKLLADTTVIQFYPSKFVLITDILDIFGKLVYERLRTKADYCRPGSKVPTSLPENFTPDMVPESAKETCQNWFYKIASIRELLPRIYVEMAILKCYSFLTANEFNQALLRLTKMIRGIGDPLVAIYARCYLCRVGMTVTIDREYIKENLNDVLMVYHTIFNGGIRSEITRHRITLNAYISLYLPALDWILQGVTTRAVDSQLDDIVKKCKEKKNPGLLILSIMQTFRPEFIASRSLHFVHILSTISVEGLSRGQLFRCFGTILSHTPPPIEHRASVLSHSWKTMSSLGIIDEYIQCVEMWAQYTSQHFGLRELNAFMGDILYHITPNRAFENHYHELQVIIDKVVTNTNDLEGLLTLENFLPMLDLFQKESVKLDVCKNILTAYKNCLHAAPISDPVITNALMYISKVLNDSVNALTVDDERRQISNLISHFIQKVDFGRDFEQQLTFYVEARSAFSNLDSVYTTLIHCVNKLSVATRRIVKGQHTSKTGAFVKACAAYCFITIPSIISVLTRMELYLLSGQIALLNLCLQQADSCFEAALNLIPELPKSIEFDGKMKSTEQFLVSYVGNFLSTLIIVPDSPVQGVLYLLRLMLDVIKKYQFDSSTNGLSMIYLCVLDFLSIASQEVYPYHIVNVISNDELYGSDPKFIAEINSMSSEVCDQILGLLKERLEANNLRQQSSLALELFLKIVVGSDLTVDKMYTLAYNLWNLSLKNRNSVDAKYVMNVMQYVESLIASTDNPQQQIRLRNLLDKMKAKKL